MRLLATIKIYQIGYYANNKGDNNENLVTKTHILNNVDIAKGTVTEKKSLEIRQYLTILHLTVTKDLNNKLFISKYNSPNNAVEIDLNTLDQNNSKQFAINIDKLPYPNNNVSTNLIK